MMFGFRYGRKYSRVSSRGLNLSFIFLRTCISLISVRDVLALGYVLFLHYIVASIHRQYNLLKISEKSVYALRFKHVVEMPLAIFENINTNAKRAHLLFESRARVVDRAGDFPETCSRGITKRGCNVNKRSFAVRRSRKILTLPSPAVAILRTSLSLTTTFGIAPAFFRHNETRHLALRTLFSMVPRARDI